jgi:bacteriocin-like protein
MTYERETECAPQGISSGADHDQHELTEDDLAQVVGGDDTGPTGVGDHNG